MRREILSPSKRGVTIACILSLALLGFYTTYTRQAFNTATFDTTISFKQTHGLSKCPIPDGVNDICIHAQANFDAIVDLCGTIAISAGRCQDRSYGLVVATKEVMEGVSEHTRMMVIQGSNLGDALDTFVQTRSHWVIDTFGRGEYEVLTTFADKERLNLQEMLDRLQHRCVNFFSGALNPYGFGSVWHNLGLGLAYSLYYNMTLYSPFERKNFIPITTCTEMDLERVFAAHPPETNYTQWNISTINFKSEGDSDVFVIMNNRTIIREEYMHKGHFWWRSMLTYYGIRPNAQFRSLIRKISTITSPCMSIHVRHSDKAIEAGLLDFSRYMEKASEYRAKTGISHIYLMTDDDLVIQSTKEYPDFKFHYMDVARSNQGWQADTQAGVSREQQEKNFLIDVFSAAYCQHSIVTYSSNVGRLIGEIAYAVGGKEPDVVSLDSDWLMYP